jgi:beta-galactosidase
MRLAAPLFLAVLALARADGAPEPAVFSRDAPRERVSIDGDWRFTRDDPPGLGGVLAYGKTKDWFVSTGNELLNAAAPKPARPAGVLGGDVPYAQAAFDDSGWRTLDLPHDWGIEGPFRREYDSATGRLPWWGVGWYRKRFAMPAGAGNRRVYLDIDGAMAYAMVWLNGRFVGGWPYGYSSFELDLTPYLRAGTENVLAIRLDNPPQSSRWYPGGGIYRNVWLVGTGPVHVAHWGTFVTTPRVSDEAAVVDVLATLEDSLGTQAQARVSTQIFELGPDGRKAGEPVASSPPDTVTIAAGRQASSEQSLSVPRPKRWSLERPQRYVAVTTVSLADGVADVVETPFGIRTIAFTAEGGFLLNGRRVPINGVCDHHDLGPLGAALDLRALERQLQMLREMGCNAIRTSHNPPAPELLDLCDRLGMLVMDESFDCWAAGKRPNDYHLLFADWHEKDLRALVRRDRNHPSVILWSIGNEIPEQRQPEGWKLAAHLAGIVREEDRTRPITAAYNVVDSGYDGFQTVVDVLGYNYKPGEYANFRRRNPLKPLFGSETASTVSSRGVYVFPVVDDKSQGRTADHQMSSYDLYAPRWATPPDPEFKGEDENPFVAGEFVWTGWDYLGEPTPYGLPDDTARSSYFGIIDLAGFRKDRFYIYQAHWRPDFPMAHLLPHWTWPERVGRVTPVHVYTSGDEAELFLNGRSLGRKKKGPGEYRIRWDDVVYEPGELKVIAYKNGKKWAEDAERTAGPAARLLLKADRTVLSADGSDLAFVTVEVADRDGVLEPRAGNHVRFTIAGPGVIAAVDNGDPTSFEPFQAAEHDAFNGLVLVIVRTKPGIPGAITLRAQSEGLEGGEIPLLGAVAANPALPSLILIGDSTVRNGRGNGAGGQWGWGEPIGDYFDYRKINVVNRAVGGLSSRTYLTGGFWDRTLPLIKRGDFVIMQFGRNDGGAINDTFRARASLAGNGEETQEIDNLLTKRHEIVHTYGWYLRKFITDVKARGATPVVCSPTPQKIWRDGEVEHEDYCAWARDAAREGGAACVDLEAIIGSRYAELGPAKTESMYADPRTHNSWAGAVLNAESVVAGLKALGDDPLAGYYSGAGAGIPAYAVDFVPPSVPPTFWSWAPRPPMGWNSWDCFATTITEAQTRAEADVMAARLRAHGWDLLTVDIQWYEPGAVDFEYRKGAPLVMDEWGRLQPAPNRFPSAAGGTGFKALADSIHGKGLKFGIHLLRGIPRQAVARNTPILGTRFRAADIADKASVCPWNTDMFGVDMSRPGAQAYYDSVFRQLADWGVDFVKVDDISQPYHGAEIAAIRTAIDRAGRPIVLSLSPGSAPLADGSHVAVHANLWRISDDFWDRWPALVAQFARLNRWTPFRGPGHYPDADMLPLGTIDLGRRTTHFTPDEQRTLMTLWSIARSPLILGADLTKLDDSTLSLITNDEVLAVDEASAGNRQLFRRDDLAAWVADVPGSRDKYLAVFNLRDPSGALSGEAVRVRLADLGLDGPCRVRDLWRRADLGESAGEFAPDVAFHGAGLYRLSPQ